MIFLLGNRFFEMPGPQLTRDDLNSLLIFENLCNDWVREVHRFTSERKKKKNFVIFRNCENKKLTSLEGLKEELDDVSFLENAEFKSAFSHDIVSNKVGANKRARRAAKAWMADPKKQVSNIAPVQEETPVEVTAPVVEEVRVPEATPHVEEFIQESTPIVEESIKVTPDDETETEPEDIKSYEEVIIPVQDTPNDITKEELASPVEEQVIPANDQKSTDPVVEDAVSVVGEEVEVTPDVDAEEETSSSFEDITVPEEEQVTTATEADIIVPVSPDLVAPVEEVSVIAVEEQVKDPVAETLVVETDADEEVSIADVKEDTNVQETSAPLEEDIALPAVEEATSTVEETKESVAAPLPTVDVPSTLPEVELVITQTSEETDQIEETPSIDIEEKEKIEEESVPIVKAETDRGSSVLSNTSDMGSMESLEAQTDSASTNSDDDNENSCSDTDIFIPTSDEKQKNVEAEDIKIEIVQVL